MIKHIYMGIKYLFIGLIGLSVLSSCTNSDDFGEAIPIEKATNYFPLTMANQWKYEGNIQIEDHYQHKIYETLKVNDSIDEADTPSYLFSSNVNFKNWSLGRVMLRNGKLNKVKGKMVYNGKFIFTFPVFGGSIKIPLYNLLLLDQNAKQGENLSTIQDSLKTTLSLNNKKIPVKIHYTLKTNEGKTYQYYATEKDRYKHVVSANLSLELLIITNYSDQPKRVLLGQQKVFDIDTHFAQQIGMISSKSRLNIKFENLTDSSTISTDSIVGSAQQILSNYSLQ